MSLAAWRPGGSAPPPPRARTPIGVRAPVAGRRSRGFTLIELLVTATIVAVLASVALPLAELNVKRSRENDLRAALRDIRNAIDAYKQAVDEGRIVKKADETGYPPTLEILVAGADDARNPKKARIVFLRRLPRDPMATDSTLGAAETWALRSYASPHDAPSAGSDVYDVSSRAEGIGMNGIPYAQW
jgi:general secretion pathway protein G